MRDDGVIFISIDDHEEDNLRKLGHEIFGERNFLGVIVWRTATDNNPTNIASDHEYILAYARNLSQVGKWESVSSKAQVIADKYAEILSKIGNNPDLIQQELRKWIRFVTKNGEVELDGVSHYSYVDERGVYYPGNSANTKPGGYNYDILHPVTAMPTAKPANGWRWPRETFERAVQNGDVHWGSDHTSVPKIKKRIETATELLKSSFYEDNRGTSAMVTRMLGVKAFENPKSLNLLKRIMKFVSSGDDIILDFFAGSGSTAHAVMDLNAEDGGRRRCIQVQLPEPTPQNSPARLAGFNTVAEICRKRIDVAGDTIRMHVEESRGTHVAIDGGFRAYTLSDTNFPKWKLSSDISPDALQQHMLNLQKVSRPHEATTDDLITEVLLKQGYSLSENIVPAEIAGLEVLWICDADGDTVVLAYLNDKVKPTLEQIHSFMDKSPVRIIMLEDVFRGNDELKTNLSQNCKSKNIEFWAV